jgi:predicted RNA binding protein YcfA (HicA-like mRNA interferase family)
MTRRSADPATLKTARELITFVERQGCELRQSGSHVIATAANGQSCVIPVHHGQLPTGTRRSILRMFARMGLLAAAVGAVLLALAVLA